MPGPGPKLPRVDAPVGTPRIPASQEKPSWWGKVFEKLLDGAMFGAGAYLAVRIIRHYDNGAPTDSNALNP